MTLAVGFFDGVHLGHRTILAGADAALTFRTHPLETLAPAHAPKLLMAHEDRLAALRASGVKEVIELNFTPELAALAPAEFVRDYLLPRGVEVVRCGENWNFGAKGAGKPAALAAFGIAAAVIPYATYQNERVSSTRIRAAIAAGEIAAANEMLGRSWFVRGELFVGKGVGREMGYPTLNFRVPNFYCRPPAGVYGVRYAGARAIANWGLAPTLGARRWQEPILEVHFVDAMPSSFGDDRIEFLQFIRPEREFPSLEALKNQIAQDILALKKETSHERTNE